MPKLANMVGETGTIEIPVSNDEPLIVRYRRGKRTPREQVKILTAQREIAEMSERGIPDPRMMTMMVELLADMLVSWNLTDDAGAPIGTDAESLQDIDMDLLTAITAEIGRQGSIDPLSGSGSSNGSSRTDGSELLRITSAS